MSLRVDLTLAEYTFDRSSIFVQLLIGQGEIHYEDERHDFIWRTFFVAA